MYSIQGTNKWTPAMRWRSLCKHMDDVGDVAIAGTATGVV